MQGLIQFVMGELPDTEIIPSDFQELLTVGKKDVEVQLFGFSWHLYTIEEWERREIVRRVANSDALTKLRLVKVEFLTQSITEVTRVSDKKLFSFTTSERKPIIRSLLLTLDSKVIDELYDCYSLLEEMAQREYEAKYAGLREQVKTSFFGSAGESSELSSSKTQPTQDSSSSSEIQS